MNLSELFNIAGKTVVVSGATGYFGRTITEALDGLGANVVAMARSERVLELIETRGLKTPLRSSSISTTARR